MQGGAVSVWHDKGQAAQHTLYAHHDLQPPVQSDALGLHASVLALVPVAPRRGEGAGGGRASGERRMTIIAVMMHGQLWKWSLPLPDLPSAPKHASALELSRGACPRAVRTYDIAPPQLIPELLSTLD